MRRAKLRERRLREKKEEGFGGENRERKVRDGKEVKERKSSKERKKERKREREDTDSLCCRNSLFMEW